MHGKGESVLVVGAGLAGTLMSIYLARAGYDVRVVERRADPRKRGGAAGRSINLALSTRGLQALGGVGMDRAILHDAIPMRGRMIHDQRGRLAFQPYGTRGQAIHSVSRLGLNVALLDAAEREHGVSLLFERKCVEVDLDRPAIVVEDERTGERSTVRGDRLVGADGAFSAVRSQMQRLDRFDYEQSYLGHGYKELRIPPAPDGRFSLEPHALHIWPRGGFMMIALPNPDRSFTATLFWPFGGPNGFERLRTPDDVRRHFQEVFPDAAPLMPELTTEYLRNPTGSLVTIRCGPWHHRDRVVLLGDACHAVVPFYGQGANAAFEDCVILDECIRTRAPDWNAAFLAYENARKVHTDALAELAVANFIEMRDHVASRVFLLRKRAEKLLHRLFPDWFRPLYGMVTFSRLPYAEARERARRQWVVVRWVLGVVALLVAAALVVAFVWRP